MAVSWTTTEVATTVISGTQVQAKLTQVDNTQHSLEIADPIKGGSILLSTQAQITELKQWLIDAGY